MSELKKVKVLSDSDGHWYVVPEEEVGEFRNFLNSLEHDYNEQLEINFIHKFSKYLTGGDINLVQLYAEM